MFQEKISIFRFDNREKSEMIIAKAIIGVIRFLQEIQSIISAVLHSNS
jgi:hypothetical protein